VKSTQCGGFVVKSTQRGAWRIKSLRTAEDSLSVKCPQRGGFAIKSTMYGARKVAQKIKPPTQRGAWRNKIIPRRLENKIYAPCRLASLGNLCAFPSVPGSHRVATGLMQEKTPTVTS
jgi:hypothetical protein